MKKSLLLAFLALGASLAFGQVSQQQRDAENATEAQSGIRDSVDITSPPTVDQITNHSAVLRWTTNKVAATRVNYGLDPNRLTQQAYLPGGQTDHQVVLHNLQPQTTYYFEIENKYGRNRLTGTFTTH
jgi:acid phosphatase type 7